MSLRPFTLVVDLPSSTEDLLGLLTLGLPSKGGHVNGITCQLITLVDRGHGGADAGEHRIANGLADSGTHGFRRVVSLHALVGEEECNRSLEEFAILL